MLMMKTDARLNIKMQLLHMHNMCICKNVLLISFYINKYIYSFIHMTSYLSIYLFTVNLFMHILYSHQLILSFLQLFVHFNSSVFIHIFIHSFDYLFIYFSFIHSFIQSFNRSFNHWFMYSCISSIQLFIIQSIIHQFINLYNSYIHSINHLLIAIQVLQVLNFSIYSFIH